MKLGALSILIIMALLYGALTVTETGMYRAWDRKLEEQKEIQRKVAYFQQMNSVTAQLLRRMAAESQHDPAIGELLKKRQIKVIVDAPPKLKEAPQVETVPDVAPVQAPDAPINAPLNPTNTHP